MPLILKNRINSYNIFPLLFMLISAVSANAQQYVTDSLIKVLNTSKEDTNQVNTLNAISTNYANIAKYEDAMHYGLKAKQQAKLLGYQKGIATAYNNIGLAFWYEGNYESAMSNYLLALKIHESIGNLAGTAAVYNNIGNLCLSKADYEGSMFNHTKALEIRKKINDKKGIAGSYNNLGNVYRTQGNYEKGIENYLKSLKLKEEIITEHPDDVGTKRGLGNSYNNIGLIYYNQRNYDKALEYYIKGLEMRLKVSDKRGVSMSYINIGAAYSGKQMYEKSLEYDLKALQIDEEIGDKFGLGMIHDNIGNNYFHLNDYEKALTNHLTALKIKNEIGDKGGSAKASLNIGRIYVKQKRFELAHEYMNQALQSYKQIKSKEGLAGAYDYISDLYLNKKDYKNAYEYHKLYFAISDTLINEQSNKQIAEMNVKYNSEKKDKELIKKDIEIKKQLAEAETKKTQRNVFIAGLGLLLLLSFYIFRSYREKRNANIELEEKNEVIERQKKLVEEKNIKITDSITYAKRIQQATLPSEELIKSSFPDSFVLFLPKDIVSGDFYWYAELPGSNSRIIVVADCTGHGVPGAFMSMIGNTLLNEIVNVKGIDSPAEILNELNKGVVNLLNQNADATDTQDDGMDVTVVKIDTLENEIEYAAANHFSYFINKNQLIQMTGDIYSIGSLFGKSNLLFTQQGIKLEKDSTVYLFSDGFLDQFGGEKKSKYSSLRFEQLLMSVQSFSMEEQMENISTAFESWKGSNKQLDDVLVIGIKI